MNDYIELKNFPGYYINADGWLYKMRNQRMKALRPLMAFPYGKYPYYVISVRGTKYILNHSELQERGFAAQGKVKR